MNSDGLFQLISADGPWVVLVFFLLWRDFQKDQATRDALDRNARVLTEIGTLLRERLPRSGP